MSFNQSMKLFLLFVTLLFVCVFTNPTQCSDGSSGNGLLEFGTNDNCLNGKVCIVPCQKFLKCKSQNVFFDISAQTTKVTPPFVDPETKLPSSIEAYAFREVCQRRKFNGVKKGDFWKRILRGIQRLRRSLYRTTTVSCLRKYIEYFRTFEEECKEKNGWQEKTLAKLNSFDAEKQGCRFNEKQRSIFNKAREIVKKHYLELAKSDNDVSKNKFCHCGNFQNLLKSPSERSKLYTKGTKIQYLTFRKDLIVLMAKARRQCKKLCKGTSKSEKKDAKTRRRIFKKEVKAGQSRIVGELAEVLKDLLDGKAKKRFSKKGKRNVEKGKKKTKKAAKKVAKLTKRGAKKASKGGKSGKSGKGGKGRKGKKGKNGKSQNGSDQEESSGNDQDSTGKAIQVKGKSFSLNSQKSKDGSVQSVCINTPRHQICFNKQD